MSKENTVRINIPKQHYPIILGLIKEFGAIDSIDLETKSQQTTIDIRINLKGIKDAFITKNDI